MRDPRRARPPPESTVDVSPRIIAILAALIVLLLVGLVYGRQFRRAREAARTEQLALGGAARRMLLETDDALRRAARELGYARAAFGPAEVAALEGALEAARRSVDGAFALGRQIDDEVPETTAERAAMLDRIVADCSAARLAVDAQVARIVELRAIAADPGSAIDEATAAVAAQDVAIGTAEATIAALRTTCAEPSLRPVAAMPATARSALDRAGAELDAARAAESPEAAAIRVSAATIAIARSRELTDAVDQHARTIAASEGRLTLLREDAASAIDRAQAQLDDLARTTPATDPAAHELSVAAERLTAARSSLGAADTALAAVPRDVLAVTDAVTAAITLAGGAARAIASAEADREAAHRSYRSAAALAGQSIAQGEAWLDDGRAPTAEERQIRAVLAAGRARLLDAERLAPSDPVGASALAWTAHRDAVGATARLDPDRVTPVSHAGHSPEREELEQLAAGIPEWAVEAIGVMAIRALVGAALGGGVGAGLGGGRSSGGGLGGGRISGGGSLGGGRSSGGF